MPLKILSGGAAQGLVNALAPQFKADTGCDIDGAFGAVGAMRDKLVAGAPADLLILTASLIAELTRAGHVAPGSAADLGSVLTGVAVRQNDASPPIGDAASLRDALRAAGGIYFPDPKLATAGIHFAKVLGALGIADELGPKLQVFPNGAAAMTALAASTESRPIGCTQITEILNTPGVTLLGPLPKEFELATVYTAGVGAAAALPDQARRFVALLTSDGARPLRERAGFR